MLTAKQTLKSALSRLQALPIAKPLGVEAFPADQLGWKPLKDHPKDDRKCVFANRDGSEMLMGKYVANPEISDDMAEPHPGWHWWIWAEEPVYYFELPPVPTEQESDNVRKMQ